MIDKQNMKLKAIRPILWSDRFDETIDFYTSILGFQVGERNDEWGWASLYKDEVEIMLAKPNEHTPFDKPVFTGSFYFTTDNVDRLWEDLKDRAKLCYEIENFDWGMRELAISIPHFYKLHQAQRKQPEI